ncbi:MAG: hypothetical protein ACYDEA_10245 [Candidatus Dormibacteria bacterium]
MMMAGASRLVHARLHRVRAAVMDHYAHINGATKVQEMIAASRPKDHAAAAT